MEPASHGNNAQPGNSAFLGSGCSPNRDSSASAFSMKIRAVAASLTLSHGTTSGRSGAVIEERCDVGAGWAIGAPRIVSEYLEFVAVESVQSVLSPKPDEPAIVL